MAVTWLHIKLNVFLMIDITSKNNYHWVLKKKVKNKFNLGVVKKSCTMSKYYFSYANYNQSS